MKLHVRFLIGLLVAVLFTIAMSVSGQTTNAVPDVGPLKPVLDLLPAGAAAFLAKVIVWVGSFSLVIAPFAVWLRHKLADMLNVAATSREIDDDAWLRRLFANPVYRFAAVLLRFLRIDLPTSAELERALALQNEAVKASK